MSNNKCDDIEGFSDKFASKIYPGFMQVEPKWGPIGKHNYEGHYSRIKRDGKYEEWRDTTIRVVDGNLGFVPKKYHEPNERESLLKLIYEFSQMPAGRHLWVTGVPGRQFINNCLQGDTKVLTRLGWKKIRDLAGTEQEIVTDEGKWVKASFKSFGVQNLCKVTYKEPQSDETYEVYATPGHDWVVEDSKKCRLPKVKTSDLKEGMRLPVVNGRSNGLEYLSPQGIQHGIVFGDGCCTEHDCHVDLFGDSFVYLDKYFPDNRKSDVTQLGQVGSRISGMPSYFKKLPDLSENKPYLLGFLAGWIAADGGIRNTSVCLFNKSKEVLEHAKSIAAICGIRSSSPRKDREGTEYKQDSELWYITFNSCDRADKLLIREDHKYKLVIPKSPRSKKYCIVQSVEETNRYEEVFCAEVPETHNFVIEGNVLTGNCFTSGWVYDRPSEHSAFLFMRLMEGGGVGSNYSNQYIEKLPFICSVPEVHFVCSPEHPDYPSMKEYLSNPADGGYAYEWQFSHQIEDSREGWREALVMMMDNFYKAHPAPLIFDLSHVRKAGAIIKSFGGTASGPLYLLMMLRQVHAVMSNAFGRKLTSLEWMLIDHYIAVCVVSGGTRRSARMAMKYWKDFDIIDFIKCKTDGMSHWTTNISVIVDNEFFRAYKAGDPHARNIMFLVSYYAIKNGEPGFFNIDLARVGEADPELMFSTNPCLTGETKVLVADGRGTVTIKELADEGKDVPVFCTDNKNRIKIRTMRHPRLTGKKQAVYKLTLDDGSTIRQTANHKYAVHGRGMVPVSELKPGDSLEILTRYQRPIVYPNKGNEYWALMMNGEEKFPLFEHRIVASHFHNNDKPILAGSTVHHKNFNRLDNSLENLEIMDSEAHRKFHAERMMGDRNPMRRAQHEWSEEKWDDYSSKMSAATSGELNGNYKQVDNECLYDEVIQVTKEYGRRLSFTEYQKEAKENCWPLTFTAYRNEKFRTVREMLVSAAVECGFEFSDLHPSTIKLIKELSTQDYDVEVREDVVFVKKKCEICETSFLVHHARREQGLCSVPCVNTYRWKQSEQQREAAKQDMRTKMLHAYNDLKIRYGRDPIIKEWELECQIRGLRYDRGSERSLFKNFKEIKEQAALVNHRVVSVEFDGYEDVYDGTVDEFHNFFVGGFEKIIDGLPQISFVKSSNCGEIAMEMWDVCNLGHINMANFIHKRSKMYEAARLMTRFLIRATYGDIADPKSRAVVDKNRRIGVGLMGYHNWLVGHGIKYSRSWESSFVKQTLRDMKEVVDREAFSYAHQLRIPVPVKRTTLAPTGTISLIPGVVSSAQSDIFNHFERRVIYNPNDPNHARILEEHTAAGGMVEDSIYSPGMKVAVSLCKSTLTEYCEENNCTDLLEDSRTISPEDMMSVQAMFQEYWADNAISYTVNFPLDYVEKFHKNSMGMLEPVWDGIEDKVEAHAKEIERLLIQFGPRLKGTTLMPDISNRPQPPFTYLTREQYEEGTTVRAIADSESACLNGACPIK